MTGGARRGWPFGRPRWLDAGQGPLGAHHGGMGARLRAPRQVEAAQAGHAGCRAGQAVGRCAGRTEPPWGAANLRVRAARAPGGCIRTPPGWGRAPTCRRTTVEGRAPASRAGAPRLRAGGPPGRAQQGKRRRDGQGKRRREWEKGRERLGRGGL
jgi:hypothetical protein